MNHFKKAKAALDAVRAEQDVLFKEVLAAADEKYPGISARLDLLVKKEEQLRAAAVKAWVDFDPNAKDTSLS